MSMGCAELSGILSSVSFSLVEFPLQKKVSSIITSSGEWEWEHGDVHYGLRVKVYQMLWLILDISIIIAGSHAASQCTGSHKGE